MLVTLRLKGYVTRDECGDIFTTCSLRCGEFGPELK